MSQTIEKSQETVEEPVAVEVGDPRTAEFSERLQDLVKRIHSLPTLPQVVSRMVAAMGNPKTSASDIERIISTDQAITAKILKLVNSSFYGFPRRIGSVCEAVVMLGFNTVRNLAITCSLFQSFKGRQWRDFDHRRFWDHCIGSAIFSRYLGGRFVPSLDGEELFVMGLLHDIGKLLFEQFCPDEFGAVLLRMRNEGKTCFQAETAEVGVTHADIGRWLCIQWNLPSRLADVVGNHHTPQNSMEAVRACAIVHLADAFCHQRGLSPTTFGVDSPVSKRALEQLGIIPGMLIEVMQDVEKEQEKAKEFFRLY